MAVSNVELYEALKGSLSKKAARMIAEVVPPAGDLLRRADLAEFEARLETRFAGIDQRFAQIDVRFAEMEARFDRMEAKFYRVAFMALMTQIPLWVGLLGIFVQLLRGS